MQVPPHIRQLSNKQLIDWIKNRKDATPTPMELFLITKLEEEYSKPTQLTKDRIFR